MVRLANMDRITAKRPPANVEKDVYGLNEYWATRGNAGTAAALCAKGNVSPRSLPYSELRTALGNGKVFLG